MGGDNMHPLDMPATQASRGADNSRDSVLTRGNAPGQGLFVMIVSGLAFPKKRYGS